MTYASASNNQWLTYTNIVEAVNNNDLLLNIGQTVSASNRYIIKSDVISLLDIDLDNFNLVNKKSNQFITKNELAINIFDFDYLGIRYGWIPGAGRDLDTLTGFETPTGDINIDGKYVGFGEFNSLLTSNSLSCLEWGGDNRQTGGEMVLVDFNSLVIASYSLPRYITASINTIWFGSIGITPSIPGVLPGQVTFQIVAWKGGAMVKGTGPTDSVYTPTASSTSLISTYDWCNPTATKLSFYQTFQKQALVKTSGANNYSTYSIVNGISGSASTYAHIGTLVYDKITQSLVLNY